MRSVLLDETGSSVNKALSQPVVVNLFLNYYLMSIYHLLLYINYVEYEDLVFFLKHFKRFFPLII